MNRRDLFKAAAGALVASALPRAEVKPSVILMPPGSTPELYEAAHRLLKANALTGYSMAGWYMLPTESADSLCG